MDLGLGLGLGLGLAHLTCILGLGLEDSGLGLDCCWTCYKSAYGLYLSHG